MRAAILLTFILVVATPAVAGLGKVRDLLKRNEPEKAVAAVEGLLAQTPNDPWLLYNAGVAAYAAKEYAKADSYWQQLAAMEMPEPLREQVWMQIGNVSFRLVEPLLEQQPDSAVSKLEQSREAYRVAIAQNPEGETAPKNLVFVEKQLEKLYARLAARLVADAKKESAPDRAIDKLYAAFDHQKNATALNPTDPQHAKAEREIEQMLAEKFIEKARESEKQGDRIADQKTIDDWKLDAAKKEFEKAIADFKQAQTFDADKPESKEGEQRVVGKLADMLAKAGQQELRDGNAEVKRDAERAMESFENALGHFEEALAVKSDHHEAQAGMQEAKQAMEKLHLQQGDRMTKTGEEQLKKNPAGAAEHLLGALDHFEQAKALNPENPEIPPRIEHVQELLPQALMAMAQREQQRAKEAEPKSVPNAVAHLELAEASYERVQQIEPNHQQAKEGQQQVQEELERLRKQLAQRPPENEQQQESKLSQQDQPSFESMLAQVKSKQDNREMKAQYRAGVKYDPARSPGLKNW